MNKKLAVIKMNLMTKVISVFPIKMGMMLKAAFCWSASYFMNRCFTQFVK